MMSPARYRPVLVALLAALPWLIATSRAHATSLTVSQAYFRMVLPNLPAAGYMTLTNAGVRPVTIIGLETSGCGSVMLHRSINRNGMDRMAPVPSVTVAPHSVFRFAPGGYHLMCMSPHLRLGHDVLARVKLQNGGSVTARFAVIGVHP